SFDVSHNYFRTVPTFDTRLIGIGILDQLLFQGVTGGFRLELPHASAVYGSVGRSDRESDDKLSWNYMGGVTLGTLPFLDVRTDIRMSRFSSSFGRGRFLSLGFTREIGEGIRLQLQGGRQNFRSQLTRQAYTNWVNTSVDWLLGSHYVLGGGYTLYRGRVQRYDQLFVSLGYRF
ncbi:MAG: hypothetical protein GY953_52485, partial [bacterium]|nr:hypothetical protein [bacterium]